MNPHEDAGPRWHARNAVIAELIPAGSKVIDLGAGAQSLRDLLTECEYTAADVTDRTPDTLPFDMNRSVYPAGSYDVAVMSGVLEYAADPGKVLRRVLYMARTLIVSYAHGGSLDYRRRCQWANHLSRAGLEELLEVYREYRIVARWDQQVIYRARR